MANIWSSNGQSSAGEVPWYADPIEVERRFRTVPSWANDPKKQEAALSQYERWRQMGQEGLR